jgi:putative flavoprotein involved in K+ transport
MSASGLSVAVIGAGPSGLATAACLQARGIEARILDRRGRAGGAYLDIRPTLTLASPARYTHLPGLALAIDSEYVTAGAYREYLDAYAAHHRLQVEMARVEQVTRSGARFALQIEGREHTEAFDAVVAATGMYDHPHLPDIPGLDTHAGPLLHASAWNGATAHRGQRVLIIGGATSAIEIAEECAAAGLSPHVSARRKRIRITPQRIFGRDIHDYVHWIEWLPVQLARGFCAGGVTLPGEDRGFRALCRAGHITVQDAVLRFERNVASFADGASAAFDVVVAATGYRFATPYLAPEVARAPAGPHPLARHGESPSWPGLYVIGMPCAQRLSSEFLRGIARDAPVVAAKIVKSEA